MHSSPPSLHTLVATILFTTSIIVAVSSSNGGGVIARDYTGGGGPGPVVPSAQQVRVLPINKTRHHGNLEVELILRALVTRCPSIMRMGSAGKSTLGTPLWYLEVSDRPGVAEEGEPEVRLVGHVHGNEVVGRELALWTAEYLCDHYEYSPTGVGDDFVTWLVNSTRIFIAPTMNPDGYQLRQRYNARHVDLNRNFPDRFNGDPPYFAAETQAMMRWSRERSFALSATFHGGSQVVNYPYDGNRRHRSGEYTATPDDRLFRALASEYARHNPAMAGSREFPNGITNGAHWYVLYGGYQDWTYLERGDFHFTIELSNTKWPQGPELPQYWADNKESVLRFMERVHSGVLGRITDPQGAAIPHAVVSTWPIETHQHHARGERLADVYTNPETGEYFRLLVPGTYMLRVDAPGYQPLEVPPFDVAEGLAHRHDFTLYQGTNPS